MFRQVTTTWARPPPITQPPKPASAGFALTSLTNMTSRCHMTEISPSQINTLISSEESDLLEFKEKWYDLESKRTKAELAKDVLAIANSLGPGQSGYIVLGVRDARHGGGLTGIEEEPSVERIHQILSDYCNPMPDVSIQHVNHKDFRLGIIEIVWSEYQPHYCTRDVDRIISHDLVYTRRGPTVGTLTPTEFEDLIRRKDARLGRATSIGELQVRFVSIPTNAQKEVVVRAGNLTEQPIGPIDANVDVRLTRFPDAIHRQGLICNMILKPGEKREFSMNPMTVDFYDADGERITWSERYGAGGWTFS